MPNTIKLMLAGVLLLMRSQAVSAAPIFSSSANVTLPTPGEKFHCVKVYKEPSLCTAQITITSANHFVSISGEPANSPVNVSYDLHLVDANNGGQDVDQYSGMPIFCDQNGNFRHSINDSSNDSATYDGQVVAHTGQASSGGQTFTVQAVADINDEGNPNLHSQTDNSVSFLLVYP